MIILIPTRLRKLYFLVEKNYIYESTLIVIWLVVQIIIKVHKLNQHVWNPNEIND